MENVPGKVPLPGFQLVVSVRTFSPANVPLATWTSQAPTQKSNSANLSSFSHGNVGACASAELSGIISNIMNTSLKEEIEKRACLAREKYKQAPLSGVEVARTRP